MRMGASVMRVMRIESGIGELVVDCRQKPFGLVKSVFKPPFPFEKRISMVLQILPGECDVQAR